MMLPRLLAISSLALSLAPAALAAPAPTVLGAPRYDAGAQALLIPLEGPPPEIRTELVEQPPILRVSLKGRAAFAHLRESVSLKPGEHPALAGWLAARTPDGVRVSLVFNAGAVPVSIAYDRARRAMVLTPLRPGQRAPQHGVPLAASVPPTYDAPRPRPVPSPTPTPEPRPSARPTAAPTPAPVLAPTPAPSPGATPGWETQGAVGVSVHRLDYSEYNPNGDLIVTLRNGRMFGANYGVRFAPPEPWRSRLTPNPAPDRPYETALTPHRWSPFWQAEVRAYSQAYALADVNLPFSHRFREDTRLEASIMREIRHDELWVSAGLGYFLRLEEAYNTGVPPDLSQAFTFNRLFHAPMARFSFSVPPEQVVIGGVRGWRLFVDYDYAPRVLTDLDKGLPGLPLLGWSRTRMGIERDWGPFKLMWAYGDWNMSGFEFEERLRTPAVTLTWTTHLP